MLHLLRPQDLKAKVVAKYYGINGERKDDGPQTLAKSVGNRYFCKFNTYGVESGHLVNPWSMFTNIDLANFTNTINKQNGKELHEYKEVNEAIFQLYTKYLHSQSDVHYRQAERMFLEND